MKLCLPDSLPDFDALNLLNCTCLKMISTGSSIAGVLKVVITSSIKMREGLWKATVVFRCHQLFILESGFGKYSRNLISA